MPAINFQSRFASDVKSGKKRQTIRKLRRSGNVKAGDTLYLYTGMRTRGCQWLRTEKCASVQPISIDDRMVLLDGKPMDWADVRELALADGFPGLREFLNFFDETYGMPFDGVLIKW